MSFLTILATAAILLTGPGTSFARMQTPGDAPAPPPATGWRDGFVVQSDKGDCRLQVGLVAQLDGRFGIGDDERLVPDTFLVRRARPYLRGRLGKHVEFFLNPDFAGGTLVLQDAYVDTVFATAFRIRVGKTKTPFGLERLHPASNLLFIERALPTLLVPNRDIGVQVLGDLSGGLVSYQAGILNGVPDGGSADIDTGDGKDVAGRLVVRPFVRGAASHLRGLGLAIAGTSGNQSGAPLAAFRTPSLQRPYFAYNGATADGIRTRYSPQLFYYHKAIGAFAEYVHSAGPVRRGSVRDDIADDAWQIAGSIVLTGEDATVRGTGVQPRADFDFGNGHYGAFQVAARYHRLTIDERAIALTLAADGARNKVGAWTAGLNWYLNRNLKYVFNFERLVLEGASDDAREAEHSAVFRTQVSF
jgi:phosphate-selective porin OprO/OprP